MNKTLVILLTLLTAISCGQSKHRKSDMPKESSSSLNISKLLESEEQIDIIIAIDDYLTKKSEYGEKIENLSAEQANFLFVENLEQEVNNGGFSQFFYNSSGDFANETVNALKHIGANFTADIAQKANAEFKNGIVPKNREKRAKELNELGEKSEEVWGKCDEEFYKYNDDLVSLLIEYIKEHQDMFG